VKYVLTVFKQQLEYNRPERKAVVSGIQRLLLTVDSKCAFPRKRMWNAAMRDHSSIMTPLSRSVTKHLSALIQCTTHNAKSVH